MAQFNIFQLARKELSSEDSTIQWLRQLEILPSIMMCPACGREMKERQKIRNRRWRCSKYSCRKELSLAKETIFEAIKLPYAVATSLMYIFVADLQAVFAEKILHGDVTYRSIRDWYNNFRNVMSHALLKHPVVFGGETDVFQDTAEVIIASGEAEIDETITGKKAKGGRGTSCQKFLVFGIVERKGTKCVLYTVENQRQNSLIPIIKKHISTSATIYHDGLTTYSHLERHGYNNHRTVNHNTEFVTEDGVHTNTVEGMWGRLKQKIAKMHGLKGKAALQAHLDEFSYRAIYFSNKNMEECWNIFINHVIEYQNDN